MEHFDSYYQNCDPVAVVGLDCRFPGADGAECFWESLLAAKSGQSVFSEQQLRVAGVAADVMAGANFVARGSVIAEPECFDAGLFGFSPAEAETIDPQQRVFLQVVWHALEDAGYAPRNIQLKTSVFGACRISTYPSQSQFDVTRVGQVSGLQALLGNDKDYLATRVAHRLNLKGPAMTVQTACSSSLVAVHMACESLRSGECDMAVAGGVAISFPQTAGYLYQPGMIFSPDGQCRPFSADANGTYGGSGAGAVILKRLSDAIEAGDPVMAVIRGSAVNNDGNDKVGFTAPAVRGQTEVLRTALQLADVSADDIEMLEAHGTGTRLGDPIEITALKQAYNRSAFAANPCHIGSVKSNFGHLDTAAGICSLIKTVLSVSRGKIPATLNISEENPELRLQGSGFKLAEQAVDWRTPLRTAGVSSFGIGGTNCHMVVQSLPDVFSVTTQSPGTESAGDSTLTLLLSAASSGALQRLAGDYHRAITDKAVATQDLAFTALHGRQLDLPCRLACTLGAGKEDALRVFAETGETSAGLYASDAVRTPQMLWCFTGQGCQHPGMGELLYQQSAVFRTSIDEAQTCALKYLDVPVTRVMFGDRTDLLAGTAYAQVAIVAFEIALARHWLSIGFTPEYLLGHSVGEYSAAVVGGYLTLQQAMLLVCRRGTLMQACAEQQSGAMLVIFAVPDELPGDGVFSRLDLAAVNGERHVVLSGKQEDICQAEALLTGRGIVCKQLSVSCAAHSRLLEPVLDQFEEYTRGITPVPGRIPLISTLTGTYVSADNLPDGRYWRRHLREPVKFHQAMLTALEAGVGLCMEIGPAAQLISACRRESYADRAGWIHAAAEHHDVMMQLYAHGLNQNWPALFSVTGKKCHGPLYSFDRHRYWFTPSEVPDPAVNNPAVSEPVKAPQTFEHMFLQFRALVAESFVLDCLKDIPQQGFSIATLIRAGRLLPRYRPLLADIAGLLTAAGFYEQQGDFFRSAALPDKPVPEALTDALVNLAPDKINRAALGQLADVGSRLKTVFADLKQAETSPLERQDLASLLDGVLADRPVASSQVTDSASAEFVDCPGPSAGGDLSDWLRSQLAERLPPGNESLSDLKFTGDDQLAWPDRIVINRLSGLWGQTAWVIRGTADDGHWRLLATAGNTDALQAHPLASPQNRYEWYWQAADSGSSQPQHYYLQDDSDSWTDALRAAGIQFSDQADTELLIVPDADIRDLSALLHRCLEASGRHILVITHQACDVFPDDSVRASQHALMALLRVIRVEYPERRVLQLDMSERSAAALAAALLMHHDNLPDTVAWRDARYFVQQLRQATAVGAELPAGVFAGAQGWHLVTGGMGGVGRLTIAWLVRQGVRNIAVFGRSEHADWADFVALQASAGCLIETVICDLSDSAGLAESLEAFRPGEAVSGIIHAAGNVCHGAFSDWPGDSGMQSLSVKAGALDVMYPWLVSRQGRYLISYSSAAVLGAAGQGAYALANGYLDGFSLQHNSEHCRVMSVAWGAWDQVGMTRDAGLLRQLARQGMYPLAANEGIWHLEQSFLTGDVRVMAMNIDQKDAYLEQFLSVGRITENRIVQRTDPLPERSWDDESLLGWLDERVRYQLALPATAGLDQQQDLLTVGMDSLQFLELNAAVSQYFGIKLDAAQAYRDMSLAGLAALLGNTLGGQEEAPEKITLTADPARRHEPFPLTPIQHAYWVGREPWISFGGIACHVVFEWDKALSEFDSERFGQAWNALIRRHDMLRMVVNAQGEQRILENVPEYLFQYTDLRGLDAERQKAELENIRQRLSYEVRPADVWPLFEIAVTRTGEDRLRLHMNLDLLQFDVQSFKIMMEDLDRAYRGESLPYLDMSFRDYVVHEQLLRQQPDWQSSWQYWQALIPELPKAPQLPVSADAGDGVPAFITLEGRLEHQQWQALRTVWQSAGVTASAGLLTIFAATLARFSRSESFTLNMTFFNRQPFHPQVQDLIGDFTSVLLMDFDFTDADSMHAQMTLTQEKLWERLSHSQVNGVEVIRELARYLKASGQLETGEDQQPLLPVVFTSMLGMSMDGLDIEKAMTGMLGDPVFVLSQTPQVWLDHQIMEVGGDLVFNWYCMEGVLQGDTLQRLFSDYCLALQALAARPALLEQPVSTVTQEVVSAGPLSALNLPLPDAADCDELREAWAYIEHQASVGLLATLRGQGVFDGTQEYYRKDEILSIPLFSRWQKLIGQWLNQLCHEQVLKLSEQGYSLHREPVAPQGALPDAPWCQCLAGYVDDCVSDHPALLARKKSALELLFARPQITASLYADNPALQALNATAARLVKSLAGQSGDSAFRVLEVGAGTAATSAVVLAETASLIDHYCFTDVADSFLRDARKRLAEYAASMSFGKLDINQPVVSDEHPSEGYQVILAVNVLHDAVDLPQTLQNLRSMLVPDGHLILIEATDPYSSMQLATVGFIEGINAFADFRESMNSAMLDLPAWHSVLQASGYEPVLHYPQQQISPLRQHLIVVQNRQATEVLTTEVPFVSVPVPEPEPRLARQDSSPGDVTEGSVSADLLLQVQTFWERLLEQPVTPDSDFFRLGGDSLLATRMVVELSKHLGQPVSLQHVFEQPVLQAFCAALEAPVTEAAGDDVLLSETLTGIWEDILEQPVNAQTDFFRAGGDSLSATRMVVAAQQAGFSQISLQQVFEHPRFSDFCQVLGTAEISEVAEPEGEVTATETCSYPLTDLQQAYWLGETDLFSLGNGVAHFYAELEATSVNMERFSRAWNQLIAFHPQLRGEITGGEYRVLSAVPEYCPQFMDLSYADPEQQALQIARIREQIIGQGISTDSWPLFDISIIKLAETRTLIHFVIDLVVADGKSLGVVFSQLQALYDSPDAGLPETSVDIFEYMQALENHRQSPAYLRSKDYWLSRLDSLPEAPDLPVSDAVSSQLAQSLLTGVISAEHWQSLQKKAYAANVLPSMVALTLFCQVLEKWSGNGHFAINVLHSNRLLLQPESDQLVGNFSTTSMLEVQLTGSAGFVDRVCGIQQQMMDDLAHADFNGQQVLREKNQRNQNLSSGMPVVFNDTTALGSQRAGSLGTLQDFGAQTPHVYLDCMLITLPGGDIQIKWAVQRDQLKPGVFDAMFECFIASLEQLVADDWEQPLQLSEDPQHQGLAEVANNTFVSSEDLQPKMAKAPLKTLCEMLLHGVHCYPDNIALTDTQQSFTYAQLWHMSVLLARQIQQSEDDSSSLVAVVMHKGWQQVVAVLAINLAGRAYMPVDAAYPAARIEALLAQGNVSMVLTQAEVAGSLALDDVYRCVIPQSDLLTQPLPDFELSTAPEDLAYVIFTSGSTGQPKGVVMDHQAVVNTLLDVNQRIGLCAQDNVLAISNLNFDLSVFDIYSTFCAGATLVMPLQASAESPASLVTLIAEQQITVWNSVPAFVQMLAESVERDGHQIDSLRQVMMSGDWIPVDLPQRLMAIHPDICLLSLGGATEAAIWSISYLITGSCSHLASVPYGKPLANQRFYVLDARMETCPVWVAGDLYIAGEGLAQGYWQDPDKTAQAFMAHPVTSERLYRTGDQGRLLPDGNIEFLGRNDHQVKVNGYRIELGEVESALRNYPAGRGGVTVREAIAGTVKQSGGAQLVGYLVLADGSNRDTGPVSQYLADILPAYMCPSAYVVLPDMPLSANGKLDRKALPEPVVATLDDQRQPETDTEVMLAGIWQQELGLTEICLSGNFFHQGGNSLTAVRLISAINKQMETALTAGVLQVHNSVERLAGYIDSHRSAETALSNIIELNNVEATRPAVFLLHPIGGHLLSYQALAEQFDRCRVLGVQYPDEFAGQSLSLTELAQHYLQEIRRVQPCGPYRLAGWSFGGLVIYELARQLRQQGQVVSHCILIDSFRPQPRDGLELNAAGYRRHFYADVCGRFPALNGEDSPDFSGEAVFLADLARQLSLLPGYQHTDGRALERLLNIYQSNLDAMLKYEALPCEFPVTLISATETPHDGFMSYQAPEVAARECHGWSDLCPVSVESLSGDHYSIFQAGQVDKLARLLDQLLCSGQENTDETLRKHCHE
ncbi:non-ribosomal peptide synthetase/type I polyketide synthase [Aliamphritea hakodatensis]|uniref:non-ribosomal peptide synthetase/type I polyketide synthase n=1 Tax=Aliamphritea hakodatensis TaxID=2895352 RepID=UPI0022FD8EB8|nr:non-ribosomal peptide synthetase/type I polyketide synthase [Aliamphritea hakodatensis]